MTDAEILQSKIDHWHMSHEIEIQVHRNTPSRRGWGLRNRHGKIEAFCYVKLRYVAVE
jgi:hypothetical protein